MLANRSTWVDIQSVSVGDRGHMEIRRYNPEREAERSDDVRLPATPGAIRDARQSVAAPLTVSSVREAAAKAESAVIEALLAETQPRLALDGATLIDLDDAGVDGSVIDVLVALAYPDRFVLERRRGGGARRRRWCRLGVASIRSRPWTPCTGRRSAIPISAGTDYPTGATRTGTTPRYYRGWGTPGMVIDGATDDGGQARAVNGVGYTASQSSEPPLRETAAVAAPAPRQEGAAAARRDGPEAV